jgi:hypothetical protein
MTRIHFLIIAISLLFVVYISRLIIKGKLREEYALIWWISTAVLLLLSIWTRGLQWLADLFQVVVPANLVFAALIFAVLIYLLHLSLVNSKLQKNVTSLTQELAILKQKFEEESGNSSDNGN